jgi:ferric hydroxamate transport system substrate-binding protein
MDERHVRVFGENGLFQAVLERLGLENAWQGDTNVWGFSLVGLEALIEREARLVVVEPYPTGVEEKLARSALWQRLPSVRDDSLITLPPVWSFGALPSARRFAELLVAALNDAPEA